jgi:peptide/nickel transport system permease protein
MKKKQLYNLLHRVFDVFLSSKSIIVGACLVFSFIILGFIGPLVILDNQIKVLSYPFDLPPSFSHLLGTDYAGRDVFAVFVYALRQSLQIGLIAGVVGVALGVVIGFTAGYKGEGLTGNVLGAFIDLFLVMPTMTLLILLSSYVQTLTGPLMALILALFAWPGNARAFRSQVMSLKEREFIKLAKISGEGDIEIIFKEVLPNLLPYIGVGLGSSIAGAMMVEMGLGFIGLGPAEYTTLGLMLNWGLAYGALTRRIWWWIAPPIFCITAMFVGLQLINIGLDEIYNPRLRGVTGD